MDDSCRSAWAGELGVGREYQSVDLRLENALVLETPTHVHSPRPFMRGGAFCVNGLRILQNNKAVRRHPTFSPDPFDFADQLGLL